VPNFRIIALDGGGIRGVLTAVLLDRLQQQYPSLLNPAGAVTLFAGTSTGGILALGLAAGLTPAQMRDLYVVNGKSIFDATWLRDIGDLGGIAGAKYDNGNLKTLLGQTFGGGTLGSLQHRVLISSFQLDDGAVNPSWKPKFFHNFPGADSDAAELVLNVAMETSAAPTYFPSYQGFIDGGVIANNPSMAALAQALDGRNPPAERATLQDITLLSIGTGTSLQYIKGKELDWGDAQWIKPLIDIMMDGSVGVADFQCAQLLGSRYQRLAPVFPAGTSIGLDEVGRIVDLLNFAQSVDITSTLAWLHQNQW
jgi:patatin-like phospholipase/acyl hydrolase